MQRVCCYNRVRLRARPSRARAVRAEAFPGVDRVFVAGATGGCGKEVVRRLTAEGLSVRALVRDPGSQAASSLPGGVELVKGNVAQFSTLQGKVEGCSHMVIATGSRPAQNLLGPFEVDFNGTVNLIAVARRAGVK